MSLDTSHKFLLGLLAFALVVEREYSFKRSIIEAKNEESTLIHNHISMKEHGSVAKKREKTRREDIGPNIYIRKYFNGGW